MPDEEHGSFSLGFTFGLLAGAAGFFVFGTERGKRARMAFARQWQEAHATSVPDASEPLLTLRDAYNHLVASIHGDATSGKKATSKVAKKQKIVPKPKEKKQTFTGTR